MSGSNRRFVLKRTGDDDVVATVGVARNETLYECLERNRHPIRTTCRGSTICGLCWVEVHDGGPELVATRRDEQELLAESASGIPNARLACCLFLPTDRDELVVSTSYWKASRITPS